MNILIFSTQEFLTLKNSQETAAPLSLVNANTKSGKSAVCTRMLVAVLVLCHIFFHVSILYLDHVFCFIDRNEIKGKNIIPDIDKNISWYIG